MSTAGFRRAQEQQKKAEQAIAKIDWVAGELTVLGDAYNKMLEMLEKRLQDIETRLDHLEMKSQNSVKELTMPQS